MRSPRWVLLTHRFTRRREEVPLHVNVTMNCTLYLAELVFLLERFAQRCVYSANESGEYDQDGRIRIIFFYLKSLSSPLLGTGVFCHCD